MAECQWKAGREAALSRGESKARPFAVRKVVGGHSSLPLSLSREEVPAPFQFCDL